MGLEKTSPPKGQPPHEAASSSSLAVVTDGWVVIESGGRVASMGGLARGRPFGRYRLRERLAIGGMAEVWTAVPADGDDGAPTVVLKVILPAIAAEPEFVAMFGDEAALAPAVAHPNVVRVLEHGAWEGRPYLVLEHVHGRTLRAVIDRSRRLGKVVPTWFSCHVACEVCQALERAHCATDGAGQPLRLVHGDITPENLMVSFSGATKVLDFGLASAARTVSPPGEGAFGPGVLAGKYAYLAPEQINGSLAGTKVDRRADIYGLGVVLYELLAGQPPFVAENDVALLRTILEGGVAKPLREQSPWVPVELDEIVARSLVHDRVARFQNVSELLVAIQGHLAASGQFPTRRHVARYLVQLFPEVVEGASGGREGQGSRPAPSFLPSRSAAFDPRANDRMASAVADDARADVGGGSAAAVAEFEAALEHAQRRDYEAALVALERAVALDPENRTYRSNLNVLRRQVRERLESRGF
ncbi:MAG: serine/threonine protein kinase [Polyangiaceae bacterium]|nr:serine/threonine protein kinase [Polyangiaceae bacterium]